MARIKVRGVWIELDILEELRNFEWKNERIAGEKFIACSPFREERRPSFFVNLSGEYAGTWRDSGYIDSEFEKGSFVKLLSFLRGETEEETEEYLIATYGVPRRWDAELKLNIQLPVRRNPKYLPFDVLRRYAYRHPYLTTRGISEKVQRGMKIGYDRERKAVTIPWFDAMGRLANIKFRSVHDKRFWFLRRGVPLRRLLYGLDVIYKKSVEEAVLCEAEIDAMTWMTLGVPAVAVGGNTLSDEQARLLIKSPVKRLVICPDNDSAGYKLVENVRHKLEKYIELYITKVPEKYKDVNDAHMSGCKIPYKPSPIDLKFMEYIS